jgi:hypothetical protein
MSNDVITQVFTPLAQEFAQTQGADIAQYSQGLWQVLTDFYQRLGLEAPQRLDISQQNPSARLQQDGYEVLSVQYLQQHPEVGYTTAVSLLDAVSKILVGFSRLAPSAEAVASSVEVRRQMGVDLHTPEIYVIYVYALFVADASARVAFIRRNVERLFADVVQQMQQHPWLMWEDRQVSQPKPQGVQVGVEQPYVQEANALTQLGLLSQGGSHSSAAGAVPGAPQPSSQVPSTQTTSVSPAPFPSQGLEVSEGKQVPFSGVSDSFSVATDVSQVLQPQQNTQVSPVSVDSSGNSSVMAFFPM